jgi:hypothetical protein
MPISAACNGGTVYPVESGHRGPAGIYVRDWLAAMAMQAIVSGRIKEDPAKVATMAYRLADAMLEKRELEVQAGMQKRWNEMDIG